MSLVRLHNFSISLDGFGTGEGHRPLRRSRRPARQLTAGLEKVYEIEATSSPSGVTHVTFTRSTR